jgi:hypothetical protein
MSHLVASRLAAFALGVVLIAAPALAQQPQVSRIRGTVVSLDGGTLDVTARDGTNQKIKLADNVSVLGLVKAGLSDIKPGAFVGITGMPQADGSQKAVEVHIFPEKLRGTGEGFREWDLRPNSTMTNGAIAQQVESNDGQSLLLKYKDGEKKIVVGADTPVVSFVDADKSDLKAGAKVIIFATRGSDGSLTAARLAVGRDGLTPPM